MENHVVYLFVSRKLRHIEPFLYFEPIEILIQRD